MKRFFPLLSALFLVIPASAQIQVPQKPAMEVVFVIDTTGSMGGLIDGAKKKIWSIVNEIVAAKPQPEIRIGFVAYRDKGDAYVTQVHDLTSDLDGAFKTLQTFEAAGGGDTPEHVNAGLSDAITKLKWSAGGSNNKLYQVVFLVGDCPPHLDYDDGLDYKISTADAAKRGIFINAIRCGSDAETEKIWLDIAKRGGGAYFSLAQNGGTIDIATPYDDEMIKLGAALELTTVANRGGQKARLDSLSAAGMGGFGGGAGGGVGGGLGGFAAPLTALEARPVPRLEDRAAASNYIGRQAFNYKSGQIYAGFDLVTALVNGRKIADLKDAELPDELRKMSLPEREKFLMPRVAERIKLQAQMAVLEKKRNDYLQAELKKTAGKDGFDQKMLGTFKAQAAMGGAFRY